ncbi:MAG: 1-deoxy-D-xylulose-5-phosphate reductoisomerase [Candidatus Marinimicrobia bacterium]|nr:1-deoxy-D-xylulose-5-phosphate reductoisomerase [Candidatus Neomarinimicrobiota bacterium]|tara:strand:+ start:266 stop:1411 length:1146 start_codon:yes stop_codon:yes gene_type:complete
MKNLGILGSTGSVGTQSLNVIDNNKNKFNIKFLAANTNSKLLIEQVKKFNPEYVCIYDKSKYLELKKHINSSKILCGYDGLMELCELRNIDIVLNSIVGYSGLEPTLKIIESGTDIALSNKESIVQAGHLVINSAKSKNVNIFPVDSEHSAIWQCLVGEEKSKIRKIILTASGGPFRKLSKSKFESITVEQALSHPNWEMGRKISIDSATMMNKGFEMIEAFWLFNIDIRNIEIVIHPQSIIHSMVEFIDGSIKAQLSYPDMRLPIQYAFSFPERYNLDNLRFDIKDFYKLNFEILDLDKFKCVKLAFDAIKKGGSFPVVLNVSNDIAVDLFLNKKIGFTQIPNIINDCMNNHSFIKSPQLSDILSITNWTKNYIKEKFKL